MVCLLVKTITTNIWSFLSQCDDNKLANLLINLEAKSAMKGLLGFHCAS
jgi:hypothetical protein